jgi:sulfite reductase alpha subunit
MAKQPHPTPLLDELEQGPWPSFVSGLKRLAQQNDMMVDLLGQLERSYETRTGYWKGGTVGVYGYGAGVIPRFTELKDEQDKPVYPDAAEFHTLRIQPPAGMHYTSALLRQFCDVWEKHGSGLIALHGQTGDMMLQGCTTEKVQPAFDEVNAMGFDLGGAGAAVRTAMSCVGAARCELSCYDEARALRTVINASQDDIHRPSLPYKFKFKYSGCGNDCVNSIQRSDMAVIGTWRDNIQVNNEYSRQYYAEHGMSDLVNDVVARCPTKAISIKKKSELNGGGASLSIAELDDELRLVIDNSDCVRCVHCLNVIRGGLLPGKQRGASILVGGKSVLKMGASLGTVAVPFIKLESDEDFEKLKELSRNILDFFAENALEHERTGEMVDRIGLVSFLEGLGLEIDPCMVLQPRANPYVRTDGWEEEVEKAKARNPAGAGD